jgi:hypothetical protein
MTRLLRIEYLCSWDQVDPESDNIDMHVHLEGGRIYSLLIATPNNIYWCMKNDGVDYFFGTPPVLVARLDEASVGRAVKALIEEEDGRWLHTYGALQET